jgi:ketosteroid isomerase-like protein
MPSDRELLERLYDRFNARDMEAALATMHPDVTWANGLEGGMSAATTASATTGRDSGK